MTLAARQYFLITKCCNSSESGFFTFDTNTPFGIALPGDSEVVVYNGVAQTLIDSNGNVVIFEPDYCYTVERIDNSTGLYITSDLVVADFATTPTNCDDTMSGGGPCEDCSTAPQMLVFTPCCEDFDTLYFQGVDYQDYLGVIIPTLSPLTDSYQQQSGGPTYNSLNFGYCYEVTVVDTTQENYDTLEQLPPYSEGNNFTQVTNSTSGLDCTSPTVIAACPTCPQTCFTAINCADSTQISVLSDPIAYGSTDISNYVGQFVTLLDGGIAIAGTWFITSGACNASVSTITVDPVLPPECDCRCFEIVGDQFGVAYVDCDNNYISYKAGGPSKFCSKIYPVVNILPGGTTPLINEGLDCVDGECPIECFILANCETGEILYTESNLYSYFLANQIVTLNGYEGCWQVLNGDCSCITFTIDAVDHVATATSVYEGRLVYTLDYGGTPYYVWWFPLGGAWAMSPTVGDGSMAIADAKSVLECPGDVGFPWAPTVGSPIGAITSAIKINVNAIANNSAISVTNSVPTISAEGAIVPN